MQLSLGFNGKVLRNVKDRIVLDVLTI